MRLGYWKRPVAPRNSRIEWVLDGYGRSPVLVCHINNVPVGWVKEHPFQRGCTVTLDGWLWTDFRAGPSSRRYLVKEGPIRGFASVELAKEAIQQALALLPENP